MLNVSRDYSLTISSLILILFLMWILHTQIKALFCPPSLRSAKMMFFSFQDFCYFHFTDQFLFCSELDLEQFPLETSLFCYARVRIARAQTLKPKGRESHSCPTTPAAVWPWVNHRPLPALLPSASEWGVVIVLCVSS